EYFCRKFIDYTKYSLREYFKPESKIGMVYWAFEKESPAGLLFIAADKLVELKWPREDVFDVLSLARKCGELGLKIIFDDINVPSAEFSLNNTSSSIETSQSPKLPYKKYSREISLINEALSLRSKEKKPITFVELAAVSGIDRNNISLMLRGARNNPSIEAVIKVVLAYDTITLKIPYLSVLSLDLLGPNTLFRKAFPNYKFGFRLKVYRVIKEPKMWLSVRVLKELCEHLGSNVGASYRQINKIENHVKAYNRLAPNTLLGFIAILGIGLTAKLACGKMKELIINNEKKWRRLGKDEGKKYLEIRQCIEKGMSLIAEYVFKKFNNSAQLIRKEDVDSLLNSFILIKTFKQFAKAVEVLILRGYPFGMATFGEYKNAEIFVIDIQGKIFEDLISVNKSVSKKAYKVLVSLIKNKPLLANEYDKIVRGLNKIVDGCSKAGRKKTEELLRELSAREFTGKKITEKVEIAKFLYIASKELGINRPQERLNTQLKKAFRIFQDIRTIDLNNIGDFSQELQDISRDSWRSIEEIICAIHKRLKEIDSMLERNTKDYDFNNLTYNLKEIKLILNIMEEQYSFINFYFVKSKYGFNIWGLARKPKIIFRNSGIIFNRINSRKDVQRYWQDDYELSSPIYILENSLLGKEHLHLEAVRQEFIPCWEDTIERVIYDYDIIPLYFETGAEKHGAWLKDSQGNRSCWRIAEIRITPEKNIMLDDINLEGVRFNDGSKRELRHKGLGTDIIKKLVKITSPGGSFKVVNVRHMETLAVLASCVPGWQEVEDLSDRVINGLSSIYSVYSKKKKNNPQVDLRPWNMILRNAGLSKSDIRMFDDYEIFDHKTTSDLIYEFLIQIFDNLRGNKERFNYAARRAPYGIMMEKAGLTELRVELSFEYRNHSCIIIKGVKPESNNFISLSSPIFITAADINTYKLVVHGQFKCSKEDLLSMIHNGIDPWRKSANERKETYFPEAICCSMLSQNADFKKEIVNSLYTLKTALCQLEIDNEERCPEGLTVFFIISPSYIESHRKRFAFVSLHATALFKNEAGKLPYGLKYKSLHSYIASNGITPVFNEIHCGKLIPINGILGMIIDDKRENIYTFNSWKEDIYNAFKSHQMPVYLANGDMIYPKEIAYGKLKGKGLKFKIKASSPAVIVVNTPGADWCYETSYGLSIINLRIHFNFSLSTISINFRRVVSPKDQNSNERVEKLRKDMQEYKGGNIFDTIEELAQLYCLSLATVSKILRELDILSKGNRPVKSKREIEQIRDDFIVEALLKEKSVSATDFYKALPSIYWRAVNQGVYSPLKTACKGMYLLFGFDIPQDEADEFMIPDEALNAAWHKLRREYHPDRVWQDEKKKLLYHFWFKHVNRAYKQLLRRRECLKSNGNSYFPGIGLRRLSGPESVSSISSPIEERTLLFLTSLMKHKIGFKYLISSFPARINSPPPPGRETTLNSKVVSSPTQKVPPEAEPFIECFLNLDLKDVLSKILIIKRLHNKPGGNIPKPAIVEKRKTLPPSSSPVNIRGLNETAASSIFVLSFGRQSLTLLILSFQLFYFFRDILLNPFSKKPGRGDAFLESNFPQKRKLAGFNGDENMFGFGEFQISRFKFVKIVDYTMISPKRPFGFDTLKCGDFRFLSFHFLSPSETFFFFIIHISLGGDAVPSNVIDDFFVPLELSNFQNNLPFRLLNILNFKVFVKRTAGRSDFVKEGALLLSKYPINPHFLNIESVTPAFTLSLFIAALFTTSPPGVFILSLISDVEYATAYAQYLYFFRYFACIISLPRGYSIIMAAVPGNYAFKNKSIFSIASSPAKTSKECPADNSSSSIEIDLKIGAHPYFVKDRLYYYSFEKLAESVKKTIGNFLLHGGKSENVGGALAEREGDEVKSLAKSLLKNYGVGESSLNKSSSVVIKAKVDQLKELLGENDLEKIIEEILKTGRVKPKLRGAEIFLALYSGRKASDIAVSFGVSPKWVYINFHRWANKIKNYLSAQNQGIEEESRYSDYIQSKGIILRSEFYNNSFSILENWLKVIYGILSCIEKHLKISVFKNLELNIYEENHFCVNSFRDSAIYKREAGSYILYPIGSMALFRLKERADFFDKRFSRFNCLDSIFFGDFDLLFIIGIQASPAHQRKNFSGVYTWLAVNFAKSVNKNVYSFMSRGIFSFNEQESPRGIIDSIVGAGNNISIFGVLEKDFGYPNLIPSQFYSQSCIFFYTFLFVHRVIPSFFICSKRGLHSLKKRSLTIIGDISTIYLAIGSWVSIAISLAIFLLFLAAITSKSTSEAEVEVPRALLPNRMSFRTCLGNLSSSNSSNSVIANFSFLVSFFRFFIDTHHPLDIYNHNNSTKTNNSIYLLRNQQVLLYLTYIISLFSEFISSPIEGSRRVLVLLCDDIIYELRQYSAGLKSYGHSVIAFSNSKEALVYLEQARNKKEDLPDVILTDRHMPLGGFFGPDFAREARRRGFNMPIIIHTKDVEDFCGKMVKISDSEEIEIKSKYMTEDTYAAINRLSHFPVIVSCKIHPKYLKPIVFTKISARGNTIRDVILDIDFFIIDGFRYMAINRQSNSLNSGIIIMLSNTDITHLQGLETKVSKNSQIVICDKQTEQQVFSASPIAVSRRDIRKVLTCLKKYKDVVLVRIFTIESYFEYELSLEVIREAVDVLVSEKVVIRREGDVVVLRSEGRFKSEEQARLIKWLDKCGEKSRFPIKNIGVINIQTGISVAGIHLATGDINESGGYKRGLLYIDKPNWLYCEENYFRSCCGVRAKKKLSSSIISNKFNFSLVKTIAT
ncbi:MAG: response regulator, partial [Candidatus Omnitrophota bacterium]